MLRNRRAVAIRNISFFKYLLRDITIEKPNHVWCADITSFPMERGFLYLFAVMDWATRRILA